MYKRKQDDRDDAPTPPPHDDPLRCRYQSGKCPNQRVRKSSGEHHSLCEEHREKANAAQRRSKRTKKQKRMGTAGVSRLAAALSWQVAIASANAVEILEVEGTPLAAELVLASRPRCTYSNGRCEAPRAIKTNGSIHRFCERHRDQAKVDQRNHVKKQRIDGVDKWASSPTASVCSADFQLLDDSPSHAVDALLLAYKRWDLISELDDCSNFEDWSSDDLTDFFADSLDKAPTSQLFGVVKENVTYDEAGVLLAHGAPWLLVFVDEIYETLTPPEL